MKVWILIGVCLVMGLVLVRRRRHRSIGAITRPRRSARTWLRAMYNTTPRTIDGWNDLTARMQPPGRILKRFSQLHPEIPADGVLWVWEALLQWIRVRGRVLVRAPTTSWLCQPSLAVDDLWQLLANDDAAWRQLPEQVQVMDRLRVRDHGSRRNLPDTYEQAYWDEFSLQLPLLFRIDEAVGIVDGRRYRAECVVEYCKEKSASGYEPEPGRTCLHGIPWIPTPAGGGG